MPNIMKAVMRFSTAGADYLFHQSTRIADEATRQVLDGVKDDIKGSWSSSSPSDPFNPPAVVTGYLDQGIKMERRDALGRFANSANAASWILRVEADYGLALEFGVPERGLEERPFFIPALERAEAELGIKLTVGFQVGAARANALTKADFLVRQGLG